MLPSNILQGWEAPQIRPGRDVCSVLLSCFGLIRPIFHSNTLTDDIGPVLLQGWKWAFVLFCIIEAGGVSFCELVRFN